MFAFHFHSLIGPEGGTKLEAGAIPRNLTLAKPPSLNLEKSSLAQYVVVFGLWNI